MGYTTDFNGSITISPTIKPEHKAYINLFSETRRMKRNAELTEKRPDPVRNAAGLPVGIDTDSEQFNVVYGVEDGYFVGAKGFCGQESSDKAEDLVNSNSPPAGQPGLWCQWVVGGDWINEDELGWNGTEKFYDYVEWMEYLIEHFFKPWGYVLNGQIEWQGEDRDDIGMILVEDNLVSTRQGSIIYD
jgi:hypothetical protein